MSFRFVDIDHPPSEFPDFVIRKQRPTLVEMLCFFLALILSGMGCVLLVRDPLALTSLLFTVIGLASMYAGNQVHKQRVKQRSTELQNALFASAICRGSRFCLIAGKDGKIIYANPGFHALFNVPAEDGAMESWLSDAKASPEGIKNILDVAQRGFAAQVPINLETKDQRREGVLLSIEPIERPKGFTLLRALDNPQAAAA